MRLAISFICILFLSACDAFKSQSLEDFASSNRVGSEANYWLELENAFGDWEKLALVTGYADDYEGCTDIADALHDDFNRRYRCTVAN